MELTELLKGVGGLVKELFHNWVGSLIVFFLGFIPPCLLWYRQRKLWKSGAVGKGDVDFLRIFFYEESDMVPTLEVYSGGTTTLAGLYGNNQYVMKIVAQACSDPERPFLMLESRKDQELVYNPLIKQASDKWNLEAVTVRALRAGKTVAGTFIFALVRIRGGRQNQYRVLCVPEDQMGLFKYTGDTNYGLPSELVFLLPILTQMAEQYEYEKATGDYRLGRVNLCCRV